MTMKSPSPRDFIVASPLFPGHLPSAVLARCNTPERAKRLAKWASKTYGHKFMVLRMIIGRNQHTV